VFQRDGALVVACKMYRDGALAALESYIDRRPWPARSPEALRGMHAMSKLDDPAMGERHGAWLEWDTRTSQKLSERGYEHDRATGTWTRWSPAGHVRLQESYHDGQREGAYGEWHENARPRQQGTYGAGKKHCVWITWYETGVMAEQITYELGTEHGSVERFYAGGTPRERGSYENGTKTGVWETWHEDGNLRWRGKLHGPFTRWHDNGVIAEQGQYVNGVKVGAWLAHDRDGSVLQRGSYRDGEKHGAWRERDRAGAPLDDRLYDDGQIVQRRGYEAHVSLGFLQPPGRDAAVSDVFSVDVAVVREHRQDQGPYFWGYGLEAMIENRRQGEASTAIGVPLRVGAMSTARRRNGLFHGTYGYAQVTPFLRLGEGGADPGIRLGVGLTSPAYSRFWMTRAAGEHDELVEILFYPIRVAGAAINHVELVYEHDQAHGAQAGVMFGFGL
jgi:antitoxin component YwqK of YwqJK toxin-antitoxin module